MILILYYTLPVVADTFIYFYSLEDTNYFCYSLNLFINSNPADIYNFVFKNKSWPFFRRFKKHTSLDNYKKCSSPPAGLLEEKNFLKFRKKWKGKSGIYKLTFLPCRLFTYFGSSKDLGERFKYHYYNTSKEKTFLALFIKTFCWDSFALTVVEEVPVYSLEERENWYLQTFMPLFNMQIRSNTDPRESGLSPITKLKISKSLLGKKHTEATRLKMSQNRSGDKNYWHGKILPSVILDAAAELKGTKVYAYDSDTFSLVNGKPFRSLRSTVKILPITMYKLPLVLDTGLEHKGYYYFTTPQSIKPN